MSDNRVGVWAMVLAGAFLIPAAAWRQRQASNHRIATAVYTDTTLTIDGNLDEPAWQTAQVVSDFTQREPDEGASLTERTEVRVLYNNEFLYIGAYCHDRMHNGIIVN